MLEIPPRAISRYGSNDYGASSVIAEYIESAGSKVSKPFYGQFQHGWIGEYRNSHPELVIGGNGLSRLKKKQSRFFVAREDQVLYLKSEGYRFVYAVGHPLIYLNDNLSFVRKDNSLLVMPMHSMPDTSEQWLQEGFKYLEYLKAFRDQFDEVAICVHPSCIKKGFWVTEFVNAGFTLIAGADGRDENSLARMRAIFSQFEYVTTNGFGSPVAYASYFGAKVSVCGPQPAWSSAARTDLFFKHAPDLLVEFERWRTTRFLYEYYPQFDCDPLSAVCNRNWADWQLGLQSKKTPHQLKKLVTKSFTNVVQNRLLRMRNLVF